MTLFAAPTRLVRRLILALAPIALLLAASPAAAQPAYRLVVRYVESAAPAAPRLAKTLQAYAAEARKNPWTRVDVLSEVGRPNRMVVLERWENLDAADDAAVAAKFDALVAGQVSAPSDHRRSDALTLPLFEPTPASAFHVVMHIDVVPEGSATASRALGDQRAAVLAAPGAIAFEAATQSNRPNHFAVHEVWRSRAAYEAYVASEPARNFRRQLIAIKGAPFDDRYYTVSPRPR